MRVDESGRQHQTVRVDGPRRRAGHASDAGDAAVPDGHRAGHRGSAGAVDDAGVGDEQIERPRGLLGMNERQRPESQRETERSPFHGNLQVNTNSTPWAIKHAMNSSKSGARSMELSPEELHGGEAFHGRAREPIVERGPQARLFVERCRTEPLAAA